MTGANPNDAQEFRARSAKISASVIRITASGILYRILLPLLYRVYIVSILRRKSLSGYIYAV
jgi:hypothetical protein